MPACGGQEIRTYKDSRNFLVIPALDGSCGSQIIFYGDDCQYMQITGGQRNVRNASTPIRSWSKTTRSFCVVGNTVAPPDIPTGTLDFFEPCSSGLPLPHLLGDCEFLAVVNHGLCKSQGDICDWQGYAEVYRVNVLSENRGQRTSNDGTDNQLVDQLNVEFLDVTDIAKIEFTDIFTDLIAAGEISADSLASDAVFACERGCGQTVCGCQDSCSDGTSIVYIGIGTTNALEPSQIYWSINGGATGQVVDIPIGASAPSSDTPVQILNGRIYSLAYDTPVRLSVVDVDDDGNIVGVPADVQTYAQGAPRDLLMCGNGDVLVIVTSRAVYRLGGGDDGSVAYLDIGVDEIQGADCCGNTVVLVGVNGQIWRSTDGGRNFAVIPSPSADNFLSVRVESSDTFWVATNAVAGGDMIYRTTDGGQSWDLIRPGNSTLLDGIRSIEFASDTVGYVIDQNTQTLFSTWLGGLQNDTWCDTSNRVGQFPTTFDLARNVIAPECANSAIGSNTALVVGQSGNIATALMGRVQISYG